MIYLCVPTHDEEQTVGVVLWKIRQVMADLDRDYQLLVADDASTDETPDVLEPYTRVLPLTVLRNAERRGYAASLEMLLREAVRRSEYPRRDVIIPLQADFTEEPDHIATLVRRIESGADIVASNPTAAGDPSRARRFAGFLARALLRRFDWPEGVRDPLFGLNAYRVSVVRRAIEEKPDDRLLRWNGWAANAALLRAAAPHSRRTETVECGFHHERLQRPTRFAFRPVMRQVFGLVRGREVDAVLSPATLVPDSVHSARSHDRELTLDSLRDAGVQRQRPESGRRDRRRRNGTAREGVKKRASGPRSKRRKPEDARDGVSSQADGDAPPTGDSPGPRKKRKRGRRKSPRSGPKPDSGGGPPAAETGEGQQESEKPRSRGKRRRGRRGGRRRRRGGSGGSESGGGPDGAGNADSPERSPE